ncbi:MAG: class I SAM-dependent methyltransferase [Anaerolineae bacterium]|nr:class I SAM-dependent methyltransferase [Anaerolineae bacterium]
MSTFGAAVAIALLAFAIVVLGWWLLFATEGVYLGRRVVVWLYDVFATRYDGIKRFHPEHDHMFLAQPIMQRVAPEKAPYVLDVATGTGRLPAAMLRHVQFAGPILALDASRRMLDVAALKLEGQAGVLLIQSTAEQIPTADGEFDVVTCLEALEFMERPARVARELCRVVRPGGWLLITNRRTGRLMPGKTFTETQLHDLLIECGMQAVAFETWQVDYDLVWAQKQP